MSPCREPGAGKAWNQGVGMKQVTNDDEHALAGFNAFR
jgi:hypothetical protein